MTTAFDLDAFRRDGYSVLPNVIPPSVVSALRAGVGRDPIAVVDRNGNHQELNVWTDCGDDLLGRTPRSRTLVELAEAALGEPVCHWHSKLSWKRPGSAARWDWHTDWGFWRHEGCARPALVTVSIALEPQAAINGCLRVVPGSHVAPPLDHGPVGRTRAADPERVDALLAESPPVDLVLEPGDLVVFDCRTLHGSGANRGERVRTILHCSYNAVSNPPSAPAYPGHAVRPLAIVEDDDLLPGAWSEVHADTPMLRDQENGYGAQAGYTIVAADPS